MKLDFLFRENMFNIKTRTYKENDIKYVFHPIKGYSEFIYDWTYLKPLKAGKIQTGKTIIYCKNKSNFNSLLSFWKEKYKDWKFIKENT